jgi:hypothetical protein
MASLCFVIGPIGKDGSPERRHSDLLLHAVVKEVLQREEFGYLVKRADEDADPGMIGDRVVSDIINADLVVADLTDLNPNVFYELGIRHSTEKPTIHVARAGTPLPFDNISHRTIFVDLTDWHSIEQVRVRLGDFVRATKQPGFKVSNPITQANASFHMRQSIDPQDQMIANLQDRISDLEFQDGFNRGTRPEHRDAPTQRLATYLENGDLKRAFSVYGNMYDIVDKEAAKEFLVQMKRGQIDAALEQHIKATGVESIMAANSFLLKLQGFMRSLP